MIVKCSRRHWKTSDNMMPMMARKGFASQCSNGSDAVVHCCHRLDSMVGRAVLSCVQSNGYFLLASRGLFAINSDVAH